MVPSEFTTHLSDGQPRGYPPAIMLPNHVIAVQTSSQKLWPASPCRAAKLDEPDTCLTIQVAAGPGFDQAQAESVLTFALALWQWLLLRKSQPRGVEQRAFRVLLQPVGEFR